MPSANPEWMGFKADIGDINRFGARYRLAKSFKSIDLESYSNETKSGYGSLFSVFLAWSAFERFLEIIGVEQKDLDELLAAYPSDEVLKAIKDDDEANKFYSFIYERVNAKHKGHLDNYFNDAPCNITYLASAIRHKFAHGSLSPNANEVNPQVVIDVCQRLRMFLFNVMDAEFSSRVVGFTKAVEEPFNEIP